MEPCIPKLVSSLWFLWVLKWPSPFTLVLGKLFLGCCAYSLQAKLQKLWVNCNISRGPGRRRTWRHLGDKWWSGRERRLLWWGQSTSFLIFEKLSCRKGLRTGTSKLLQGIQNLAQWEKDLFSSQNSLQIQCLSFMLEKRFKQNLEACGRDSFIQCLLHIRIMC